MKKTLVVLAAGMGSRFGGLKQIQPVGPNGEFIIDYSIHDALKAGIEKVVFIIRKENEQIFRETIGKRIEKFVEVVYAFQELDILPIPVDIKREKPLGTTHAIYCAKDYIDGPFITITSDDYYGPNAFQELVTFMEHNPKVCIGGYPIGETILLDQEVKRGVIIEENGEVKAIKESKVKKDSKQVYCETITKEKENFTCSLDTLAGMMLYGFNIDIFPTLEQELIKFLKTADLTKDELILTDIIDIFIKKQQCVVTKITDKWMGMTYKEDLVSVQAEIQKNIQKGIYKENLWENDERKN